MSRHSLISRVSLEVSTIIFTSVVTLIFGLSLLLISNEMDKEFVNYHTSISTDTTNSIGNEIQRLLEHKKYMVETFLSDNLSLVIRVATQPEDDQLYQKLSTKLSRYFNDYVSSSIATDQGHFIVNSFDGRIGNNCRKDAQNFLATGVYNIRVHPNATSYHYDVLVNFVSGIRKLLFFVSFNTDEISSLLKTSMPDKHNLMIVNKDENLIEITPVGSRDQLPERADYHLTDDEQKRILSSFPIDGTYWKVIDIRNKGLFKGYRQRLLKQGVTVYSFFILLTLLMSLALYIGIKRKNKLQRFLIEKNKEIIGLNKELETLSLTDSLTGLHNRRYLDIKSASEYNTARRLNIPLSIAVIDIDYFKQYNDIYGHQAGDACIIAITQKILQNFRRSNESAARYGGEEFIIINLGDEISAFIERLEKFLITIEAMQSEHTGSTISDYVTISIGVAAIPDNSCSSIGDLIRKADIALYLAKEQGRNRLIKATASNAGSALD